METKEKYLLVAINSGDEDAVWASISELSMLLETAGGEAVDGVVQNLLHPDPATYVGSGKAVELGELVEAYGADGILCDDELSPAQIKNLSEITGCKVIDRTLLILDIFAAHAKTSEGKVQVEMAQLKYRLAHLRGLGMVLSRLGGGIGTRGPGETKLETDRRAIMRRISALSSEIKNMENVREVTRKKRQESPIPVFAIVGYTNAGKSTLLNRLTSADVLAEDKLFATLDPTTRLCRLQDGQEVLFTDTVGFINKLPHQLIEAFKSTLEEASYADYIIHVVDCTDENALSHMSVVYRTLSELGVSGKPILTVLNKYDLIESEVAIFDEHADHVVKVSAKNGDGMDAFYETLIEMLKEGRIYIDEVVSYDNGSKVSSIRKYGQLLSEEYLPEGIHIKAYVPHRFSDIIKS